MRSNSPPGEGGGVVLLSMKDWHHYGLRVLHDQLSKTRLFIDRFR